MSAQPITRSHQLATAPPQLTARSAAALLGRTTEAAAAYATARALTANPVEQAFLDAQRAGGVRTGKV